MVKQWKPRETKEPNKPLIEIVALKGNSEKGDQVKVYDNGDIIKTVEGKEKVWTVVNKRGCDKGKQIQKETYQVCSSNDFASFGVWDDPSMDPTIFQ